MGYKPRCATPGAKYGTTIGSKKITLTIDLPHDILKGLGQERRDHLSRSLHNAILPVIEGVFLEQWPKLAGEKIDSERMPLTWSELFRSDS